MKARFRKKSGLRHFQEMKNYRVYILENEAKRRYFGLSEDVHVRLKRHNAGDSKWTAKYRPWKMVWTSIRLSLSDARKLENKMKRQKGGRGLQTLLKEYFDPNGLKS